MKYIEDFGKDRSIIISLVEREESYKEERYNIEIKNNPTKEPFLGRGFSPTYLFPESVSEGEARIKFKSLKPLDMRITNL